MPGINHRASFAGVNARMARLIAPRPKPTRAAALLAAAVLCLPFVLLSVAEALW